MNTPSLRLRAGLAAVVLLAASLPALAAGAGLPAAAPESLGFSAERLARIDQFMDGEIAAKRKAGAVVLVARHGKIAYFKAYGTADLASGRPMRSDDYFRLWSMTKPVTSVALLTLYEQGKFRLTDPLAKYIPGFAKARVLAGVDAMGQPSYEDPKRPITIQDVMRHTAGLTYGYFGDTPVDAAYRKAGVDYEKQDSVQSLSEAMAAMPLLYQPGTRWVYSFSHEVQARLVEIFSGMRFDAYCRKAIFEPLGMKDTFFGIPEERRARFAQSYSQGPDGKLAVTALSRLLATAPGSGHDDYDHFTQHPFGGAGLASTPLDYLRFAQMLLNGGELDGHRVLGRKTVELMSTNALPEGLTIGEPGEGYGLGVGVTTSPALAGHLGSAGSFGWGGIASTRVVIDPKEDLVALLFTQYVPSDYGFIDPSMALIYQALVK